MVGSICTSMSTVSRSSCIALPFQINFPRCFSFLKLFRPMPTFTTVKSASSQRVRSSTDKTPPVPYQQQKENAEKRHAKQDDINNAVNEWFTYTLGKANELAERFDKKPQYFLDIFFQGGARMVNHHSKTSAYNAFISLKAKEVNAGISSV